MSVVAVTRVLRETFLDNPMHAEATRTVRRLRRTGTESGKVTNGVAIALIALFYLWMLISIVRYQQDMTEVLLMVELTLITAILPLSVYGAISGEREKQTWEALVLTRLTPGQIIAGKLLWRLGIALLIMAILSVPMLLGQVVDNPADWFGRRTGNYSVLPSRTVMLAEHIKATLLCQATIFSWALLLASFGLFVSASSRRSISSLAVIVGTVFGVLIVLPSLIGIFGVSPGEESWYLHPFVLLAQMMEYRPRGNPEDDRVSLSTAVWVYSLVSAAFLYGSHVLLRRLEEPGRR